jgi:hypothetical protein
MWMRANVPIIVDYKKFTMTFGKGEIFWLAPYEVLKPANIPVSLEIPNQQQLFDFMERIMKRLELIALPMMASDVYAITKELSDRDIKYTTQKVGNELGICREWVSRIKRRTA